MKLSERDRYRLRHMLDSAQRAVRFAENRRRADLDDEDDPLVYALKHLITIVGEAAGEVSQEAREQLKELPWPDIVNMRHRIIHAYFDVSLDILWDTVQVDLPKLIALLEAALAESEGDQEDHGTEVT